MKVTMNDSPQPNVKIMTDSGRLDTEIVSENYIKLQIQPQPQDARTQTSLAEATVTMNDSPQPNVQIVTKSGRLDDAIVSENYMELQIQHQLQFAPALLRPATFTATEAETKKEEKDAANKHRNKENELN